MVNVSTPKVTYNPKLPEIGSPNLPENKPVVLEPSADRRTAPGAKCLWQCPQVAVSHTRFDLALKPNASKKGHKMAT